MRSMGKKWTDKIRRGLNDSKHDRVRTLEEHRSELPWQIGDESDVEYAYTVIIRHVETGLKGHGIGKNLEDATGMAQDELLTLLEVAGGG